DVFLGPVLGHAPAERGVERNRARQVGGPEGDEADARRKRHSRRRTVTTFPKIVTSAGSNTISSSAGFSGRRTTLLRRRREGLTVASSPGMPATTVSPGSAVGCLGTKTEFPSKMAGSTTGGLAAPPRNTCA